MITQIIVKNLKTGVENYNNYDLSTMSEEEIGRKVIDMVENMNTDNMFNKQELSKEEKEELVDEKIRHNTMIE